MPSSSRSFERKYFWHASISFWNKQFLTTTKTCLFLLHCVKCVQIQSIFWSVFSRIRTEYGDILRISPYWVQMWENTDQKKLRIWTLFMQCVRSEDWNSKSQFFFRNNLKPWLVCGVVWNKLFIFNIFSSKCCVLFSSLYANLALFCINLSKSILNIKMVKEYPFPKYFSQRNFCRGIVSTRAE